MVDEQKPPEQYSAQLERELAFGTARFTIKVSTQKGALEDINGGMNAIATALRGIKTPAIGGTE